MIEQKSSRVIKRREEETGHGFMLRARARALVLHELHRRVLHRLYSELKLEVMQKWDYEPLRALMSDRMCLRE